MTEPPRARLLRRRVFLQLCGTTAAGVMIAGRSDEGGEGGRG